MLDFRCVIIPRFVYATRQAFNGGQLVNSSIQERLARLARDMHRFSVALRQHRDDLQGR